MKNYSHIRTTIIGLVAILGTLLVASGKIDTDQAIQLKDFAGEIISGVSGVLLIFLAKD